MFQMQHYSNNLQLTKLIKHVRQWSHLVDETCSHSLTAAYNINRPVALKKLIAG